MTGWSTSDAYRDLNALAADHAADVLGEVFAAADDSSYGDES